MNQYQHFARLQIERKPNKFNTLEVLYALSAEELADKIILLSLPKRRLYRYRIQLCSTDITINKVYDKTCRVSP